MSKFRRSRFFKFTAGMLILVLAAAITGNIIGTILIMDENLYYASREHIQQKVYSYIYDYTSSDLMKYLSIAEKMQSTNTTYKNYNISELDLYRSKYDPANSNIAFRITDEKGHTLLKNTNAIKAPYFSFSSVFSTDTVFSDNWYMQGNSDRYNSVTEPLTSVYDDTTSFEGTTEIWESIEEETIFNDDFTETMTDANGNPAISDKKPVSDTTDYSVEEVFVSNLYTDKDIKVCYFYTGSIESSILNHCKNLTKELDFDISEISFWQDDFSVYYNEDYQSDYIISQTYQVTDEAVPTKKFTTKLYANGKEADITYVFNGSFFMEEFSNRLSQSSLILENSENSLEKLDYYQKSRINLKVEVLVPHYSNYVKDIYFRAEELVDIAILYKNNIIPVTVLYAVLFLMCFIYIFWSAGYVKNTQEPVARGLHRIPFDLYTFISIAAGIGCIAMIDTGDVLFNILGFIMLAILLLGLIYTLAVRLRAGTIKKNTVIYKLYHAIKNAASVMNEETNSKFTVILVLALFGFFTGCELFMLYLFNPSYDSVAGYLFIIRLLEIPVILILLIALVAVHNGARAISKGDITYRIKQSFLFGPIKKHAEYLNSINNAVNTAVEERMKSESMKTELITNVSHDLKTPLTSIVNYVDLLKKEKISNPKANEYIEVIDRQSQRLKKLAVDIVEASKAATGNIEVHLENTALNVILLQTNGEYIERLEEKNLLLVPEIPDETITVSTDGRLLWRIIDNLMNNICKYSMPGTRVYLSLEKSDRFAVISFRNISREKLNISPESLTERFVRGDVSRNTEGSGLGLSIANSLAKIIGGELKISIDGDLFKVTLSIPLPNYSPI